MSDKASIIKEAQKHLARGQIDKAIAEWEKLASDSPDGNTFNTIGDLYLRKGRKSEALDSYHKAAIFFREEGFSLKSLALYKKILNINPADATALLSLAELNEAKGLVNDAMKFYLAAADSLAKEGDKEKLREIYEKIIALSPSNIPLRNKVAEVFVREGLQPEAVKQYQSIARLYADKGDTGKALDFYRKTLDIEPVNRDAILETSTLYVKTGDFEKGVERLKEASSLFPQDTEILLTCADILAKAGKSDEATELLRQVIEIEPANSRARKLLGDIHIQSGDKEKAWAEYLPVLDDLLLEENYDDAIKLLDSFKQIDPVETGKRLVSLYKQIGDNVQTGRELTSLGEIFIGEGRQKEALNCYREALKITPDDGALRDKVIDFEKEISKVHISAEGVKTFEEAILESDIYLRYGLYENAKALLEPFREKESENIDLHLRLKTLYIDTGDTEQAISECLLLNELYRKAGDVESSDEMIKEAREINPEDPRLTFLATSSVIEEREEAGTVSEELSLDDYSEEIAEAEFYARQGLIEEAREILERLQTLFPESEEINQKLGLLGQTVESEEQTEILEPQGTLSIPDEEIEAEEIVEPALDSDVQDIFNEFKKGLEKELEEEDYETHYNLGIAYKEMGLIDDAIREFQTSRKDPKRFVHASNMLGICYVEKELYPLAIEALKDALEKMEDQGESFWAMKYDLAEAYERNGSMKEAFDFFTQVYGWNSNFRTVSDKINHLRASIAESTEPKKTKDRKDRVSYL